MELTIPSGPQYHEQFESQLDHHPEQLKSSNYSLLVYEFHWWDQLATLEEGTAVQILYWEQEDCLQLWLHSVSHRPAEIWERLDGNI